MTEPLQYTPAEAEREAAAYQTPAAVERRRVVREHLDVAPGDDVLAIGCGPGFEPAELSDAVGRDGTVHGVDRSDAMLELAARRCSDVPQVSLSRGDAATLPVADGSFDAAVAVQVYEYVDELDAALEELRRVLRPGGRAVVYDTDFDSLVWRSSDTERMERVVEAFDSHCPRPHLGSRLAPHLQEAGLAIETVEPYTILNTRLEENSFGYQFLRSVSEYVRDSGELAPRVVDAWESDLRSLDRTGETFFSLTQYLYVARNPV